MIQQRKEVMMIHSKEDLYEYIRLDRISLGGGVQVYL